MRTVQLAIIVSLAFSLSQPVQAQGDKKPGIFARIKAGLSLDRLPKSKAMIVQGEGNIALGRAHSADARKNGDQAKGARKIAEGMRLYQPTAERGWILTAETHADKQKDLRRQARSETSVGYLQRAVGQLRRPFEAAGNGISAGWNSEAMNQGKVGRPVKALVLGAVELGGNILSGIGRRFQNVRENGIHPLRKLDEHLVAKGKLPEPKAPAGQVQP